MDDLDDVIDRLYGLPPSEFIAERTATAKALDGEDAKRVKALRKPSAAAHAVNTLVRTDRELVEALVDVGDRLRQAQSDGDGPAMRELSGERRGHESAAVQAVGGVSASVRGEVESTLRAVVLDSDAAEAVLAGRLVTALDGSGFGVFEVGPTRARPAAPRVDGTAEARRVLERARRDLEAREETLDRASRTRDDAEADLERAQDALDRAEQDLATARERADAAALAVSAAERDLDQQS